MTPQKLKSVVRISTIAVTFIVILFVCIISFQCIKIGKLNAKAKRLDKLSQELTVKKQQLEQGVALRKTDSYIEQVAREQLGMAGKDDKLYVSK